MMSARRTLTWLLTLPLLLLSIMVGVFILCARWLGAEAGYLVGFGFYWLFWCLFIPRALLGKAEFARIISDRTPLFSRANWLSDLPSGISPHRWSFLRKTGWVL